jgi:hypothetical protein
MKLRSQGHYKPRNSCRSSIFTCQRPGLRYSHSWPCYVFALGYLSASSTRRCTWIHGRVRGWTAIGEDVVGLGAGAFSVSQVKDYSKIACATLRREGLRGNNIRLFEKVRYGADSRRGSCSVAFFNLILVFGLTCESSQHGDQRRHTIILLDSNRLGCNLPLRHRSLHGTAQVVGTPYALARLQHTPRSRVLSLGRCRANHEFASDGGVSVDLQLCAVGVHSSAGEGLACFFAIESCQLGARASEVCRSRCRSLGAFPPLLPDLEMADHIP